MPRTGDPRDGLDFLDQHSEGLFGVHAGFQIQIGGPDHEILHLPARDPDQAPIQLQQHVGLLAELRHDVVGREARAICGPAD